jgi:DNA (cytosine-5)-methyltransferase 1
MLKIGSLCTGYGGLDMAVEAFFNAETVWTCEFDKHASQIIELRINKVNHGDLKKTDWTQVEPIDILTAGYPCQPFSHAGARKGADDERHLWPYIKEIIRTLRPQFVILENVRGHFGLGFREVLADLASIRYDTTWRLVRASDVGAPHRRERLFILAYSNSVPHNDARRAHRGVSSPSSSQFNGTDWQEHRCGLENAVNSSCQCITHIRTVPELGQRFTSRRDMHLQEVPPPLDQGKLNAKFVEYMMGLPDGWVTDVGLSRAQQLKILGNGVVPQQAYYALELLWDTYTQHLSTATPNLCTTHAVSQ